MAGKCQEETGSSATVWIIVGSIVGFIAVLSFAYCIRRRLEMKTSTNSLLSDYDASAV